jgi:hypothetical protein
MKNNNLILFAFLNLFLVNSIFAQSNAKFSGKMIWGEEYREPTNSYLSEILGNDGSGFYALRRQLKGGIMTGGSPQKIYIEKYNQDMKLKKSKEIDLRYKKKKRDFEKVLYLNNQFYLMTSFNNKAHKANYLFVQSIKKKSLSLSNKIKKIAESPARDEYREGKFNFHISKDSSNVLIYSQLPYQKKGAERFSLQVFDNNFEKKWERDIQLPYPDNRFSITDYRVDNNGNVYLLGVLYENQSGFLRRNMNYQYIILAYTEDGEESEEYDVNMKDKFITDLTFRVGKDGKLICSGFYSEKNSFSIKGTYFFQIDPITSEVSNANYKEFDFDFVTEYYSDRKKRKAKKAEEEGNTRRSAELYQYSLNDLILRSDGGAVLIAEQYYVERREDSRLTNGGFYNPYGFRNNQFRENIEYYYNYNDIIIVNIRPNGEIQWASRIPKRQETRNDGGYYSSYAMAIVRDKICFVYNDNGKNFGAKKNNRRYGFNGSNSILALTEVGMNGSVNTYPISSNREQGIITRPKICKQIGKRKVAIFGERGKRFKFGKLEL